MIHLGLIAAALAPAPVIMGREPRSPSYWTQSIQAVCGRSRIVISGYGASVLKGAKPRIARNGQALVGPDVAQLLTDLSIVRGAYRFSVLCGWTGTITVRVLQGEPQRDGSVRYRAGTADIVGNRLVSYVPLEVVEAQTFWFR